MSGLVAAVGGRNHGAWSAKWSIHAHFAPVFLGICVYSVAYCIFTRMHWKPLPFSGEANRARPGELEHYLRSFSELEDVGRYKYKTYEMLLSDSPGSRYLELGCGDGSDALQLARLAGPAASVTGIDKNPELVALARQNAAGDPRLHFAVGDAKSLEFVGEAFDACRADRVLQHLDDPDQALREMRRVLVHNGCVVIADTDWDTLTVDTPNRSLTRAIMHHFADSIPQPWMGRQLPALCQRAGFRVKRIESATLIFRDVEAADRITGIRRAALSACEAGGISLEDAADWLWSLEQAQGNGEFFCSVTGFAVLAIKSEAPQ
jgi:ubiquinone/menaquinone biosynthesis C-methylase UbiE